MQEVKEVHHEANQMESTLNDDLDRVVEITCIPGCYHCAHCGIRIWEKKCWGVRLKTNHYICFNHSLPIIVTTIGLARLAEGIDNAIQK